MNWELVINGMKSIQWLRECNNLPDKYGEEAIYKTIGEVWTDTYGGDDLTHRLLNPSILMMAAYLYFVYPKESLDEIDFTNISIDDFTIVEQERDHSKEKFIDRLRNSISHARYEFENHDIIFHDLDPYKPTKPNKIVFKVHIEKFGAFLEQFRLEVYRQKKNRGEAK